MLNFWIISTGNVIADTQYSGYIRSYEATKCNGYITEKGHLQDYDLSFFIKYGVPNYIIEAVKKSTLIKNTIFYIFKHYIGDKIVIDGCVLTTGYNDDYKLIEKWYLRNSIKSIQAVNEAIKYITNEGE